MKTCAVIPAAGRGSRLNINTPKLLASLTSGQTIWSVLREKLLNVVDHIHIIASPDGEPLIRAAVASDQRRGFVSISIQPEPLGMGDAIFRGFPIWSQAENILVVWGDQAFVSKETFQRAIALHGSQSKTICLPLVQLDTPYVAYLFDVHGSLTRVRQSREGDDCGPSGLADVGTFVLSVAGLRSAWQAYQQDADIGSTTKEINFLPFLPYLSTNGWRIYQLKVTDPLEARGINTPGDLLFFQQTYGVMAE